MGSCQLKLTEGYIGRFGSCQLKLTEGYIGRFGSCQLKLTEGYIGRWVLVNCSLLRVILVGGFLSTEAC